MIIQMRLTLEMRQKQLQMNVQTQRMGDNSKIDGLIAILGNDCYLQL